MANALLVCVAVASDESHPGLAARVSKLLDLASRAAEGDRVVGFETNSPNSAFPWSLSELGLAIVGAPSEGFPINAKDPYVFKEAMPEQPPALEWCSMLPEARIQMRSTPLQMIWPGLSVKVSVLEITLAGDAQAEQEKAL